MSRESIKEHVNWQIDIDDAKENEDPSKKGQSKAERKLKRKEAFAQVQMKLDFAKVEDLVIEQEEKEIKKKVLISNDDEHSRILASFVPDEIIYDYNTSGIRTYEVALLLGDVSGFTDLCEKYNKAGTGGPSRLTEVLNGYIGSMTQEIMSGYGDVLNFSGDAFLAWWKTSPEKSMQDVVGLAIDCAIMIQKNYGTYDTDVGVTCRVKVGISAGTILFSVIGTEKLKYFIIVGRPICDVKLAEHLCTKGDVMVSPFAWRYIPENSYIYEEMPDGLHKKVRGAAEWKRMQLGGFSNVEQTVKTASEQSLALRSYSSAGSRDDMFEQNKTYRTDDYLLRPSVNEAAKQILKEPLRPFIFPPVMKGIDMNEPLEYLTEMRHVVIMFVNVITGNPGMYRLVSLVDEAYCSLCNYVEEYRGTVNKCSMFDKDLMFLVVYGLRGYKHNLESRSALRCSAEVYTALTKIKDIFVVSIGVTTGMTYCGAVGHPLRREYTVIGAPVNKAARLMMAYPSRVTCDRETFLQSQLEARHFVLQEAKELKGLGAVGPIYEYVQAAELRSRDRNVVCKYPLLGREKEMQIFKSYVDRMIAEHPSRSGKKSDSATKSVEKIKRPKITVLVIQGLPRQGKSRLMDEMIFSTDPNIFQVNRVRLTCLDKRIPYRCIQQIFYPILHFQDNSSVRDKEEILSKHLQGQVTNELLCCFNDIFKVAFVASEAYYGLPKEKREKIQGKTFMILVKLCFTKQMWVLGIDDCESIDIESWSLIQQIIEEEYLFSIMTYGFHSDSHFLTLNLSSRYVRKIILEPIDKRYHTALACQMLEVKAIPPELEKEIHDQSYGSPGWIESYLVCLMQGGCIEITSVPRTTVEMYGLIVADLEYIVRNDVKKGMSTLDNRFKKKHEKLDSNLEVEILSDKDMDDQRDDGWGMYRLTYEDSMLKIIAHHHQQREENKEKQKKMTVEVVVCILTRDFVMSSVKTERTMNVMVIKTFDSLTSYQQMILKYGSVIGEMFTRSMLKALILNVHNRELALAVKHLFDIRVLGCAGGNFQHSSTFMTMNSSYNRDTGTDNNLTCICRGIYIPSSCTDLPRYASCGYMRFRNPVFKETVYHLLTNVQKKDAHMRAVKYLGRETRRCQACGEGRFVNILGNRMEEQKKSRSYQNRLLNQELMKKMPSITTRDPQPTWLHPDGIVGGPAFLRITREDMLLAKYYKPTSGDDHLFSNTSIDSSTQLPGSDKIAMTRTHQTRFILSDDHSDTSLTHSFTNVSFADCECSLILMTLYTMLVEHCRLADEIPTLLDALLEFAGVCIASSNLPLMMQLIDEALTLLSKSAQDRKDKKKEEEKSIIPKWKHPYFMGRIHTLVGYLHLGLNQVNIAYKRLYLAMKEFGEPFPVTSIPVRYHTRYNKFKMCFLLRYMPQVYMGRLTGFHAAVAENMAKCLSLICMVFQVKQNWSLGYLAASWGLNVSLQIKDNFIGLCNAFTNIISIASHFPDSKTAKMLEISALRMCSLPTCKEATELEAIFNLYYAVFISRLYLTEIRKANILGLQLFHITYKLQNNLRTAMLVPFLVQGLLFERRVGQAVLLLHTLELTARGELDKTTFAWFYALGLHVQLDTGYTVVTIDQMETFLLEEGEELTSVKVYYAKKKFFLYTWIWCVRNAEWEAADFWSPLAQQFHKDYTDTTISNVYGASNVLECLLIMVVVRVDMRDVKSVAERFEQIKDLMKKIGKTTKICKLMRPRYLHMKAYYHQIRYHDKSGMHILARGKKLAIKHGNLMEVLWMEHSEKAWKGILPPFMKDMWLERCEPGKAVNWVNSDNSEDFKLSPYSLPLPKYSNKI